MSVCRKKDWVMDDSLRFVSLVFLAEAYHEMLVRSSSLVSPENEFN